MAFILKIIVFSAVILAYSTLIECSPTKYVYEQILDIANSNLNCLEKYYPLSANGTFGCVAALGLLHEVRDTVPNLSITKSNQVEQIENRLSLCIEAGMQANPNDLTLPIWQSKYYSSTGNYKFISGRIPLQGTLDKTILDIVKDSEFTPYTGQCLFDIFQNNPPSLTKRVCLANCNKVMTDFTPNPENSNFQKAWYVAYEMALNCSNIGDYITFEVEFCKDIKKELNTMLLHKNKQQFEDVLYYFANRVVLCSSWGVPEFLTPDIITTLANLVDCNGCVGSKRNRQDIESLTAQTTAVFSILLRYVIEQEYSMVAKQKHYYYLVSLKKNMKIHNPNFKIVK